MLKRPPTDLNATTTKAAFALLALVAIASGPACGHATPPASTPAPQPAAAPAEDEAAAMATGVTANPKEGHPKEGPTQSSEPELSPRERDRRGDEHLLAGRFDDAVADFDAFLVAEPASDPFHWRRGIALYYAGRYADGAAQFERHRAVNPDDVENAAWHFLCKARAVGVAAAREALLPVGPDQRDPMVSIYELYAGRATPQSVLTEAKASRQRDALFFAHLYLGLYYDALADADKARIHIGLAAGEHARPHYMGDIARVHRTLLAE